MTTTENYDGDRVPRFKKIGDVYVNPAMIAGVEFSTGTAEPTATVWVAGLAQPIVAKTHLAAWLRNFVNEREDS